MRTFRPGLVAVAVALALPAAAQASTVGESGDTLVYSAAPGEANQLFLQFQQGEYTVQDGFTGSRDTLPVTADPPCRHDDTPQPSTGLTDAYCPADGIGEATISLGDGDDYGSIALPVPMNVDGGPGDDTLYTVDGVADHVSCGDGNDKVTADPGDVVAADCETVSRDSGTPPGGDTGSTGSSGATGSTGSTGAAGSPATAPPGDASAFGGVLDASGGGALDYTAGSGIANDLELGRSGNRIAVTDGRFERRDLVTVHAPAPCSLNTSADPSDAVDAFCPADAFERIGVWLGDGNDRFTIDPTVDLPVAVMGGSGNDVLHAGVADATLFGGPGNDTLDGGDGMDELEGGPGDDRIDAVDGGPDHVNCGPGLDLVQADKLDAVDADCEIVNGAAHKGFPAFPSIGDVVSPGTLVRDAINLSGHCSTKCVAHGTLTLAASPAAGAAAGTLLAAGSHRSRGGDFILRLPLTAQGARRVRGTDGAPVTLHLTVRERGRSQKGYRQTLWLK